MFKNKEGKDIDVSYVSGEGNLWLKWGINNCGFGELYISQNKENEKFVFDTEYMGRNSVKAILCKMVDDGIFSDFEEEVKKVTPYSDEEAQALSPFGEKDSMYFTMPFYMDIDPKDSNLIEMRFHGQGTSVLAFWLQADKVYKLNDMMVKKYKEDNAQFNIEDSIENNAESNNLETTTPAGVEIFSYGDAVKNNGWQGALVRAEKWEWEVKEKKKDKQKEVYKRYNI